MKVVQGTRNPSSNIDHPGLILLLAHDYLAVLQQNFGGLATLAVLGQQVVILMIFVMRDQRHDILVLETPVDCSLFLEVLLLEG